MRGVCLPFIVCSCCFFPLTLFLSFSLAPVSISDLHCICSYHRLKHYEQKLSVFRNVDTPTLSIFSIFFFPFSNPFLEEEPRSMHMGSNTPTYGKKRKRKSNKKNCFVISNVIFDSIPRQLPYCTHSAQCNCWTSWSSAISNHYFSSACFLPTIFKTWDDTVLLVSFLFFLSSTCRGSNLNRAEISSFFFTYVFVLSFVLTMAKPSKLYNSIRMVFGLEWSFFR